MSLTPDPSDPPDAAASNPEAPSPRRMSPLVILLLVVLAPLLVMAIYVEDWSRDLTTNRSATAASSPDERLRPIDTTATTDAVTRAVNSLCEGASDWSLGEAAELPSDSPLPDQMTEPPVAAWSLVHTTGVMRYRDDVWLVAEPVDEGRLRLHAESRSRVGKGDLGQNPRNLRELLGVLRQAVPVVDP
ncbi:MAG: DUF1499 domain-containing protein [Planctomycetota bacterium]